MCVGSIGEDTTRLGRAVIIKPEVSNAKSESCRLEDLFERTQISQQTRLPNLMESKSTRWVEEGEDLARIIREFEDKRSPLCYKSVV